MSLDFLLEWPYLLLAVVLVIWILRYTFGAAGEISRLTTVIEEIGQRLDGIEGLIDDAASGIIDLESSVDHLEKIVKGEHPYPFLDP